MYKNTLLFTVLVFSVTSCVSVSTETYPIEFDSLKTPEEEKIEKTNEEISLLSAVLKNDHNNAKLRFYRGINYLSISNIAGAYNDFQVASQAEPTNASYTCGFGVTNLFSNKRNEAVRLLSLGDKLEKGNEICQFLREGINASNF